MFDLKVVIFYLSHLVLVEFLESGVNFWFAQPPPSCSLRKGQLLHIFLYDFDVFVLKSGLPITVLNQLFLEDRSSLVILASKFKLDFPCILHVFVFIFAKFDFALTFG